MGVREATLQWEISLSDTKSSEPTIEILQLMELEVAAALLDASRRLSSGDVATEKEDLVGGPRMRTGSLIPFSVAALAMWRSGEGQITKPDNPPDSGWLGGWRRGTRALSESEGPSSILSWLTGSGKDKTLLDQSH